LSWLNVVSRHPVHQAFRAMESEMTGKDGAAAILARTRGEPRLGPHFAPERLELAGHGTLTLAGEVASVAARKPAHERAAACREGLRIVDRLHVAPAAPTSDAGIRARLRHCVTAEPLFTGFAVREAAGSGPDPTFRPVAGVGEGARWRIDDEARDGAAIPNGTAPGLVSKRLADVMAWRVRGVRDVENGLAAPAPEDDAPIAIGEAVRVVLARDPVVDDTRVRAGARHGVDRLTGRLPIEAQRDAAERDAWCVFGVDRVIDEIEVRP
jgi:hypothetical protein